MYHLHGSNTRLLSCYPRGFSGEARAEGSEQGGEDRTPTCLINPSFKRSSDSGLLPVQEMEGALCIAICVGKATQDSCPPTHSGTQLCQEAHRSLRSIAYTWGPAQLILILLPQPSCEWDRDAHWAWERAPMPHHLLALLLLGKGRTIGDRQMDRRQGVTETCSMALLPALSIPFSVGVGGGVLGLLVAQHRVAPVLEMVPFP